MPTHMFMRHTYISGHNFRPTEARFSTMGLGHERRHRTHPDGTQKSHDFRPMAKDTCVYESRRHGHGSFSLCAHTAAAPSMRKPVPELHRTGPTHREDKSLCPLMLELHRSSPTHREDKSLCPLVLELYRFGPTHREDKSLCPLVLELHRSGPTHRKDESLCPLTRDAHAAGRTHREGASWCPTPFGSLMGTQRSRWPISVARPQPSSG